MKQRARRARRAALISVLGLTLGLGGGATYAAFSWTTSNDASTLATAPDWTPPSASASVIATSGSATSGTIRPGAAYFVYANVTDSGHPAAGVASVTANVSNITTGQSAAPLGTTGGPWVIDGTSYLYRSSSLSANNPLSSGVKTYTLTMTDAASPANSTAQSGFSVIVSTAMAASDVQTTHVGTTGRVDANDAVIYTYSTAVNPASIMTGFTGASTSVTVTFTPSSPSCATGDAFTVASTNLGIVCLMQNFINGNRSFNATMSLNAAQTVVTVTITNPSNQRPQITATGPMTWTPTAAVTDTSGNACSTIPVTESGSPADTEF